MPSTPSGESHVVGVCFGMTCQSRFSKDIYQKLQKVIERLDLSNRIKLVERGCCGKCVKGPNIMVAAGDYEGTEVLSETFLKTNRERVYIYSGISANDIPNIIQKHVVEGDPVESLLFKENSLIGAQERKGLY